MNLETIGTIVVKALQRLDIQATVEVGNTPSNGADVKVELDGDHIKVYLFNALLALNSTQAIKSAIRAVGQAIFDRVTDEDRLAWTKKLVFSTQEDVSAFQSKLQSQTYPTFKDLIDSLPNAVSRLVAIHLSNGILSSGQSIKSASNLNVVHWGTTAEFATQKKPYSIVPLVSTYAPAEISQDFSLAFAALAMNGLDRVRESSCRKALITLVQFIVRQGLQKTLPS